MISFKEPIQMINRPSEIQFSDICAINCNDSSLKQQESSDQSIPYRFSPERKIKKVYVHSRCCSQVSSARTSNYNNSNRSSYEDLTRPSTVRNRLISLPFLHNSTYVEEKAATKIQSIARRYLTIRKYYLYEKQRVANRNQLIEDALSKRNINIKTEMPKSQISVLEKKVRMLSEQLKSPKTSKETETRILSLFFNCIAKRGTISLSDLVFLLCDIINIKCKRSDFYDIYNNKSKFRTSDKITFLSFSRLFTTYKSTHSLKQSKWYSRIVDVFSNEDIPLVFLKKFNSYEIVMYDVIYSLQKYDIVNPKLFCCSKCNYSAITPLNYIKHSLDSHCC